MRTLYAPGDSMWHRLPAGRKAATLAALVLAVSILPQSWGWPTAAIATVLCIGCYSAPGIGMRRLLAQLLTARWLILLTLVGQLLFLGPSAAVVNTARVSAVIVLAALLAISTKTTDLLDAMERGLAPLRVVQVDPRRVALLLAATLNTLPALAHAANQVREAQRARGAGPSLRLFAVPFLILALKHADELGDALAARGVR